jgi:hypothetical protein
MTEVSIGNGFTTSTANRLDAREIMNVPVAQVFLCLPGNFYLYFLKIKIDVLTN